MDTEKLLHIDHRPLKEGILQSVIFRRDNIHKGRIPRRHIANILLAKGTSPVGVQEDEDTINPDRTTMVYC